MKLDLTQRTHAALHEEHVVRFVITHIGVVDGLRRLTGAQQGRYTHETEDGAQADLNTLNANSGPERLADIFHAVPGSFQVRAAACYPGHFDPMAIYFDGDDEGDGQKQIIAAAALEVWSKLDDNQRHGIRFGLFPSEPTLAALERHKGTRDASRLLSVALMEKAARTPQGISLAALGRVGGRSRRSAR